MKKISFISIVAAALVFASCSSDDLTPDSLKGTTWEYSKEDKLGSATLASTTITYTFGTESVSIKEIDVVLSFEVTNTEEAQYTYEKPNLKITLDDGTVIEGSVKDKEMTVDVPEKNDDGSTKLITRVFVWKK